MKFLEVFGLKMLFAFETLRAPMAACMVSYPKNTYTTVFKKYIADKEINV